MSVNDETSLLAHEDTLHEKTMSAHGEITSVLAHGETLHGKTSMSAHGEITSVLGEVKVTETNELITHGETMSPVPQLRSWDLLGQRPLMKEHTHSCTDKWETGMIKDDPLTMIVANDPVMCANNPEDKVLNSVIGQNLDLV
jgi:hypothetical protein